MTTGVLRIADVVVPAVFTPMVERLVIERSPLIQSGAMVTDPALDAFLNGAGLTVNMPKGNQLDVQDQENVSSDDPTVFSVPNKPTQAAEVAVRLSRNNSWSDMDLVSALLGYDPMQSIATMVADYWTKRRERAVIAHLSGIFAMDAAATDAYHTQGEMTRDISGSAFAAGVTNFGGGAFIDAQLTMSDAMDELTLMAMHPVVYANARKANLISFIQPSEVSGKIPVYQDAQVIVARNLPMPAPGVFETWLFGRGAVQAGSGRAKVPNETLRVPGAGNGGGQEIMWDRVEWAHHVPGTAFIGAGTPAGGPSNAATTGNLAAASSWRRIAPDRRYLRIARIVSREFSAPA